MVAVQSFFFSKAGCLTKFKEINLPIIYLYFAGNDGFMTFQRALALSEKHRVLSGI